VTIPAIEPKYARVDAVAEGHRLFGLVAHVRELGRCPIPDAHHDSDRKSW
jgi:hypothetical protein